MTTDLALLYACILGELVAFGTLIYKRIARNLPVFTAYLAWTVLSDVLGLIATHHYTLYLAFYRYELPLDTIFQFCVLLELVYSVLRPYHSSLRRGTMVGVTILLLFVGCAVWPLAGLTLANHLPGAYGGMFHLVQTASILRILAFLVLASCSQILGIGWRDRELQIATGLGFYSLITFGAAVLQAKVPGISRYHHITQVITASYICSLVYWIFSFMQKEALRQEFTPRMQNILFSVAGAARANRVAMTNFRKSRKP